MDTLSETFDIELEARLHPGTVIAGKYEIESPIAHGGMGTVWRAKHLTLSVPVAVKVMRETSDSASAGRARARFEQEAKASARLRSPHIVEILDYGVELETPYLVLEWLDGEDLATRVQRVGPLPLDTVCELVDDIARGLEIAHEARIIHRDLKPSNIFLARLGQGKELVKLLDFGIAKRMDAMVGRGELTESGAIVGSPAYLSPEQARGEPVDSRTDLWALGVTTFYALTSQRPFVSEHVGDLIVKICTAEVPSAREIAPHLPPEIDAFFAKALCRSADGRFPTASAYAAALRQVAGLPRDERTPQPVTSAMAPSPRADATMSLILDVHEARTATLVETSRPPRRRGVVMVFGVVVVLAITGSFFLRSRSPVTLQPSPPESVPLQVPQASTGMPSPPPEPSETIASSTSSSPPSVATAATTPRRSKSTAPARHTPTRSSVGIDPKFGLPVQ